MALYAIPPTCAAQWIIISGFFYLIKSSVSIYLIAKIFI